MGGAKADYRTVIAGTNAENSGRQTREDFENFADFSTQTHQKNFQKDFPQKKL